ncbi:hypothetical protein F751_4162 [Auxenochlorella protothecoides]|uniref:Uncharacterized protein n=1 Tax=Auxenochlorella protothecoides TaxID=3075 RepID=A0A087SJK6_AUXPR|nr:hypothetical protein F751_4162 [Auxenochlorella protothecoides]KFM25910.1 hypothetical protein F751_4162 [Auxenochlorella protothecoides]
MNGAAAEAVAPAAVDAMSAVRFRAGHSAAPVAAGSMSRAISAAASCVALSAPNVASCDRGGPVSDTLLATPASADMAPGSMTVAAYAAIAPGQSAFVPAERATSVSRPGTSNRYRPGPVRWAAGMRSIASTKSSRDSTGSSPASVSAAESCSAEDSVSARPSSRAQSAPGHAP